MIWLKDEAKKKKKPKKTIHKSLALDHLNKLGRNLSRHISTMIEVNLADGFRISRKCELWMDRWMTDNGQMDGWVAVWITDHHPAHKLS